MANKKMRGLALAMIAASVMSISPAAADVAPAENVSRAAADSHAEAAEIENLESAIRSQLVSMVSANLRVDRVTLGCKPPIGSNLKTVAPGLSQLTSRSFMVELENGAHSTYCSATMDASQQVLVATRDIQPNEPVASADFQLHWVDAFGASTGALLEFPAHGPYASATVVHAGQPLYQSSLLRPIAVHPGEMILVLVRNGPVSLRAQLQAQSQGSVGDSVTAVNPASGMPVTVTVTGPRNAELVMQ